MAGIGITSPPTKTLPAPDDPISGSAGVGGTGGVANRFGNPFGLCGNRPPRFPRSVIRRPPATRSAKLRVTTGLETTNIVGYTFLNAAKTLADADALFADQENLGTARYLAEAQKIGVDMQQYLSCVSSKKYDQKLSDQSAEGQLAGAQGTPYTVVYSKNAQVPLSGALPDAQFRAVIKAVQAKN